MDLYSQAVQKYVKIVGGTITLEGFHALGDYGEVFIAWKSISQLMMVLFEKPQRAYYAPYLIILMEDRESIYYIDGVAANYRELIGAEQTDNADYNLKRLIKKILGYATEACVAPALVEFMKGGPHLLTRLSTLAMMGRFCDEAKIDTAQQDFMEDFSEEKMTAELSLKERLSLCKNWREESFNLCASGFELRTGRTLNQNAGKTGVKSFQVVLDTPADYYMRASAVDPLFHLPRAGLALSALSEKRTASALQHFQKALLMLPYPQGIAAEYMSLYTLLLAMMVDQEDDDGTILELCEFLLGFSPRPEFMKPMVSFYKARDIDIAWYTHFLEAFKAIMQRRYAESLEPLEQAMLHHHDFVWAHHWQGVALSRMNRPREAQRSFEKTLDLAPSSHTIVELILLRKKMDSLELPEMARKNNPYSAWPYYFMGTYWQYEKKQNRRALHCYGRSIGRDPNSSFISRILEENQKIQAAESELRRAHVREELKRGDLLGGIYEITRVFKGGMGIVYIAYESSSNTLYAIKTFQEQFLWDKSIINMFINEAETWIKLERHENIVQAKFIKLIDEKPYLFLDYIRGTDLQKIIDERQLTIEEVVHFSIQFCKGMSYAYSKLGIVHRDIKPSNCLISDENVLKITDFGLVKIFKDRADEEMKEGRKAPQGDVMVTATSSFLGTVPYMAPERLLYMESGDIQSDIYSFGVMLYQITTGRMPVDPELLVDNPSSIATVIPVPPREICPGIPEELASIMMKCLEKEPEDRYPDFDMLEKLLMAFYARMTKTAFTQQEERQAFSSVDEVNKGNSLLSIGNYHEALESFERALSVPATKREALLGKSLALLKMGNYQEALWCFDEILVREPQNQEVIRNRGSALIELGRFEEAQKCFDMMISLNPSDALSWWKKGIIYKEMGACEQALKFMDKAIEYNPRLIDAWDTRGTLLAQLGRYDEALQSLEKALEINPVYLRSMLNKAQVQAQTFKMEEAQRTYQLILTVQGTNREALMGIAQSLKKMGQKDDAIKYYNKVIYLSNTDVEALFSKARLLQETGRLEDALEILKRIYDRGELSVELYSLMGSVLKALYYYQNAERFFQAILEEDRDNEVIKTRLNEIASVQRIMQPLRNTIKVLASPPCETSDGLNSELAEISDISERLSFLNRNIEQGCEVPHCFLFKSKILWEQDRPVEALLSLDTGMKTCKDNALLREERETLMRHLAQKKTKESGLGIFKKLLSSADTAMTPYESYIKGRQNYLTGNIDDAIKILRSSLRVDTRNAEAWYRCGLAFKKKGETAKALECLDNAVAIDQSTAYFWYDRALLENQSGNTGKAMESLLKSLYLNPSDFAIWASFISLLLESGHRGRASLYSMTALEILAELSETQWAPGEIKFFRAAFSAFTRRYNEALSLCSDIEKENPRGVEHLLVKGLVCRLMGDSGGALDALKEASIRGTGKLLPLINLGYVYEHRGEYGDALECYDKILSMEAKNEKALYRKSLALFRKDLPEEGLLCVDSILDANPLSACAWKSKGTFLFNQGKEEEALFCFKKAAENAPEDYVSLYNLAYLLNRAGRPEESLPSVERLLAIDGYSARIHTMHGNSLAMMSRTDEAIAAYDRALLLEPAHIDASLHKALLLHSLGNGKEAFALIVAALESEPMNLSLWNSAAFILSAIRCHKEAREYLERGLQVNSRDHMLHYNLGVLLIHQKQYADAQKSLDSVIYIKPDFLDGWFARGILCELTGAYGDAINYYEQASRLEPKNALFWLHKGNAFFYLARPDDAVRAYTQAIRIQPAMELPWLYKAAVLNLLNRGQEASQTFSNYREMSGDLTTRLEELKRPYDYEIDKLLVLKMVTLGEQIMEDEVWQVLG